jgi:hypothetical protein
MMAISCSHPAPAPRNSAATSSTDVAIWWAPSLGLDSIASIDSRLDQRFSAPIDVVHLASKGQLADRQIVTSCASYFALRAKGYEPVSEIDSAALKVEGAKCHAIEALRSAKPASRRWSFELDKDALARLPAALAPAPNPTDIENRAAATQAGKSWRGYDGSASLVPTDASRARVGTLDSTTEIETLGRADFDGDGVDDILLLTVSQGTHGSWREVRLRLLVPAATSPVLRVAKEIPV